MKHVEGEPIDSIKEEMDIKSRLERRRKSEEKEIIINHLLFEYEAKLNTLNLSQLKEMRSNKWTFDPPVRVGGRDE